MDKKPVQLQPWRVTRYLIYVALILALAAVPAFAEATRTQFDTRVNETLIKLNAEAAAPDGAMVLAQAIHAEYETPIEEIQWAMAHEMNWGSIAAYAYIRATTGDSFATLDDKAAGKNLWLHVETAGMNPDKMERSLGALLKRVEKERNTRIFEQRRSSRRVSKMPDLGSGFGLLQETLDFRRMESPRPTKIHTNPEAALTKGGQ